MPINSRTLKMCAIRPSVIHLKRPCPWSDCPSSLPEVFLHLFTIISIISICSEQSSHRWERPLAGATWSTVNWIKLMIRANKSDGERGRWSQQQQSKGDINLVVDDSSELSSENEGMRNNSVTSGVPPPHLALSYYFSTGTAAMLFTVQNWWKTSFHFTL